MKTRIALITPVVAAVLLAASAAAVAQTPPQDARARYEQEREKCMTNNTQDT